MARSKRPIAVLKEQEKIPEFIIQISGISTNIGGNIVYGAAVPTPGSVDAKIVLLTKAQVKAKTHVTGSAGDRDVILEDVRMDAFSWVAFVQGLADRAINFAAAVALIQGSGLLVKVNGRKVKAPFAATNKKGAAGVVDLIMKAIKAVKGKTTYEWRYSRDNGVTWIPLLSGGVANEQITGLISGESILTSGRYIADRVASAWITEGIVVA